MTGVNEPIKTIIYHNCEIHDPYWDYHHITVKHRYSHEILFAINETEAFKIARLLDLEWHIGDWENHENTNND